LLLLQGTIRENNLENNKLTKLENSFTYILFTILLTWKRLRLKELTPIKIKVVNGTAKVDIQSLLYL